MRRTTAARSAAGVSLQTPSSKLRRAAPIACSICAVDAVSTSAIVASVAGFSTASVGTVAGHVLPVDERPARLDQCDHLDPLDRRFGR